MTLCYIGMGSNLSQPQLQLQQAKLSIHALPGTQIRSCSSIYQSQALTLDGEAPNGEAPNSEVQADYLNAVIEIETELSAELLLDALLAIENQQGRIRGKRWGARTIDLDILLFGDQQINTARLTVPHAEIENRNFVLMPLYQIAPQIDIPGKKNLQALLTGVSDQPVKQIGEFNG